jgi:hypothetical protein
MNLSDSITITALSATFCLIGLIAGIYYNIDLGIALPVLNDFANLIIITLSVFVLSVLFFGYLSPILFMAIGIINSQLYAVQGIISVSFIAPLILASFAGAMLGTALKKEIDGKENILEYKKPFVLSLVGALVFAIIVAMLF